MKDKSVEYTKSESEVIELLIQGLNNQQIADKRFCHEKTVKFHLSNVYKKCGFKNRSYLIARELNKKHKQEMQYLIKEIKDLKQEQYKYENTIAHLKKDIEKLKK
jgi:DNA-binding CsgD family transcriptional regulator